METTATAKVVVVTKECKSVTKEEANRMIQLRKYKSRCQIV